MPLLTDNKAHLLNHPTKIAPRCLLVRRAKDCDTAANRLGQHLQPLHNLKLTGTDQP